MIGRQTPELLWGCCWELRWRDTSGASPAVCDPAAQALHPPRHRRRGLGRAPVCLRFRSTRNAHPGVSLPTRATAPRARSTSGSGSGDRSAAGCGTCQQLEPVSQHLHLGVRGARWAARGEARGSRREERRESRSGGSSSRESGALTAPLQQGLKKSTNGTAAHPKRHPPPPGRGERRKGGSVAPREGPRANKDACRPRQDECPRSPGGPSQAGEGWLAGKTGRRPRVGGRWPRKKVRGCSVAAPRGEDRGEGAATHPGCRATRSRRREPGLDAAAHERCRLPAQASPGAGGGAPRRGGVPTWVGGRGPSRESRLVAGPRLSPTVGVGGSPGGTTDSLAQTQAVCSVPGHGSPRAVSERGSRVCTALRVDY